MSGDRPCEMHECRRFRPVLAVCPGVEFSGSFAPCWQCAPGRFFLCVAFTGAVKLAIGGLSLYVPGIVLTCKTRDGSFFLVVYECGSEGEGR